jgi:hypothetical protein
VLSKREKENKEREREREGGREGGRERERERERYYVPRLEIRVEIHLILLIDENGGALWEPIIDIMLLISWPMSGNANPRCSC